MAVAHAQKKVIIGVSIPAADYGWTAAWSHPPDGEALMAQHPGRMSSWDVPDPATQANAVQDLCSGHQRPGHTAVDPDPLVNAIEVKNKNICRS